MKQNAVWLPEAIAELNAAWNRYRDIRPELAERFADAVDKTMTAICAAPLRFATVHKDKRRAGVKKFPHGIFFFVKDDKIVIVACFHGKRNPTLWQKR